MYLHTKGVQPNLVAVDHESGMVWSYALPNRSMSTGHGWIQSRLAKDIDNAGYKDVKIAIKSDQEKVMVAL